MSLLVESAAATPPARRFYTYEELLAEMPESNLPCELWDGELIMAPAPYFFHQEVSLRFYRALFAWVRERDLGKVIAAPVDMVLTPHRVVQPDVAFIAKERLGIIARAIMGAADLVAEVVSLGGRSRDRIEKRDLYEQHGVKEYWIIDPEAESVDVLFLANGRYELAMRRHPGEAAASTLIRGFEIPVAHLFRDEGEGGV